MKNLKDYKECRECGCLTNVSKMKKVEIINSFCYNDTFFYYCNRCAPNYNKTSIGTNSVRYFKDITIEVDESGKKIK